ncbi:MAG: site-specific DNA-methyltransferase [Ruminococcus sp.]|nr:site-specific DNA-methyltransferase [Ruminococcus sp.]
MVRNGGTESPRNQTETTAGRRNGVMDRIIIGDALERLRELPDEIADVCVTSPPYYGLRDYGVDGQVGLEKTPEEYIDRLVQIFREVRRTLKKDGTLWIVIADSYAGSGRGISKKNGIKNKDLIGIPWMLAFALRTDGWYLRSDIIWNKPNVMPESVKDRCTKCYEHVFMLAKSKTYHFDSEAVLVPAHYDGRKETINKGSSKYADKIVPGKTPQSQHMAGKPHQRWRFKDGKPVKNRRDVWTVSTRPYKGAHFATFPPELIEPCILAGSRPGGTVLDPFIGSGTTAEVAHRLGRECIGIELNPGYEEFIRQRAGAE